MVRKSPSASAGASASRTHRAWLENIDRRGIAPRAVAEIVRDQHITRDSFRLLDSMPQIADSDGKTYFVVPATLTPSQVRRAVLLTYLVNAGTGYGETEGSTDFPAAPYGAVEARRIVNRQYANRWSYPAARSICYTGGCLVTTPNGVLMAVGGNRLHGSFSHRGGTMWGDVFVVNCPRVGDPAGQLRAIIHSGRLGPGMPGLDRLLHHEEIHAQQWAVLGPVRMPARYMAEEVRARIWRGVNRFECDAGLRDGGYQ